MTDSDAPRPPSRWPTRFQPPYDVPTRHFEIGPTGPTGRIVESRRPSESYIPVAPVFRSGPMATDPTAPKYDPISVGQGGSLTAWRDSQSEDLLHRNEVDLKRNSAVPRLRNEGGGCASPPAQIRQVRAGASLRGANVGFSRMPFRHARHTRVVWSTDTPWLCRGRLPPIPAPPGAGCPQLHRPAATGRRGRSLTSTQSTGASRRTGDMTQLSRCPR